MKKIIIPFFIYFVFNSFIFGQTVYSAKYKSFTINKEKKSQLEDMFLNNIIYNFYCNNNVCYLKDTNTIEANGVESNISGDENIYVNYIDNSVSFKLNSNDLSTYKNLVFKRTKSNLKILGMKTSKYVSEDGNIILYTTKELPWYLQPCLFCKHQMSESIIRFENLKSKSGLELIEFKENNSINDFKEISNKILSKKASSKKNIILCPFFKLD